MASTSVVKVKLLSLGLTEKGRKTNYFKTTTKNKKTKTEKLKFKHYDPLAYNPKTGRCGMHVLFEETKI